jgi:phasin family protein
MRKKKMAKTNSTKSTVDTATKTMDSMAAASKETLDNFVAAGNDAANKGYEKAFAFSKEQADAMNKNYDQAAAFSKENVDAVVEAGNIAAKGMEAINTQIMNFTKTAFEANMASFSKLMAVKSPQEAVEMQSEMAKTSFDALVAKTTEINEMSTKLANEAIAPVSARANVAMESFAKPFVS